MDFKVKANSTVRKLSHKRCFVPLTCWDVHLHHSYRKQFRNSLRLNVVWTSAGWDVKSVTEYTEMLEAHKTTIKLKCAVLNFSEMDS